MNTERLRAAAKRVLPRPVQDRVIRPMLSLRAVPRGLKVLANPAVPSGRIEVFYGYRRLPARGDIANGGIVKFQRIQHLYPNSPDRFNVLYLVSSRLPSDAPGLAWFAKRKGIRLVVNQNGVAYPGWAGASWQALNQPMAQLVRMADHVFYQTQFCKDTADRFGVGPPRGPWEVLYNCADTARFTPAEADPDQEHLTILLGGSQYQGYRLETALRVLYAVRRQRPDARLLVSGRLSWLPDESAARRLAERWARELGVADSVTYLGPYTQEQAPSVYRRAHLLLHTKYNDPSTGMVVEAMACGLPVVYSKSGGISELVGEEGGIGVPTEISFERDIPPDPDTMAEAVLRVAADRRRYAEAARRRVVAHFDIQPWIRRHQDVFQRLVGAA